MTIKSGFFNSVDGDRTYNAVDISNYTEGILSNGVVPSGLQVTANGTMNVSVASGRGLIDSFWIKNDASYSITLPTANVLDRIDAIVMRYTVADREIVITVKQGVPQDNPVAPTMTRNPAVQEYCLAQVLVSAGATGVSSANITDTRGNNDLCGYVRSLLGGSSSVQIVSYQDSYTTVSVTTTIPIEIEQYESGDAILVFLAGMLLREGYDYIIEGINITLLSSASSGRTYTYIVFKAN